MVIRQANPADVGAMLAIYAPYVRETAITFEYVPPTEAEFSARFMRISAVYPWLVLEEDGRILGYAFADRAFEKAAYAWCADVTVYLYRAARGRGLGSALYQTLEEALRQGGWQVLYALVTASNEASLRFHAARGFRQVGLLAQSGWKLGRWHDVIWLEKRICDGAPGEPPQNLPL